MRDRDRLIHKIMSLKKPTISLQTAMDIADAVIDEGVILPPCKVGDKVWIIDCYNKIQKCEIFSVNYYKNRNDDMWWLYGIKTENFITLTFEDNDIGKTVFLTREEAEQALKGGEG